MRKSVLLSAMLLAVACKGSDTVAPPVTTTVQVSSSVPSIAVDETAQASAIVKDQNGNALTGKTVTFTSLTPGIASVTAAGVIRGVAPGLATIQGTVDGVSGRGSIEVVARAQSCVGGPATVDLAVGQVRVLNAAESKGCIRIASTAAASQYVVVAANTNALPDIVGTYTIKSDEGETVPSTNLLAGPARASVQLSAFDALPLSSALQSAFEGKWRRQERRTLDLRLALRPYAGSSSSARARASLSVAIPVIGEKTTFKVPAQFDSSGTYQGGSCLKYTRVTATAQYISNRAIIYADSASPPGGFSALEYETIGREFDNLIYPTDVEFFGTPSDLDQNGRVIILYTPLVNKMTPAGNPGGFVGGFFFAGDLFPVVGTPTMQGCEQSNVAEIFYVLTPDPNGTINGNSRATEQVRQGTRGTIAHEFQHMINASERISNTSHFESTWLDEGLAHFAEDLTGRRLKGFTETENLSFDRLCPGGCVLGSTERNDYNAFFFQNFARFRRYVCNPAGAGGTGACQNPGPNAPTSQFSDSSLADRGAAWALVRYTADHYAPGGEIRTFIKSLVSGPDTGVVNLRSRAGSVPFDTLIAGWMVANYADDAGIPGLPVKYTYKTYDIRSNVARLASPQVYPLVVNEVSGSGYVLSNLQARSASGNYFRFSRPAGGPARSFRFLGLDGVSAASFTGATLIVLRSQ